MRHDGSQKRHGFTHLRLVGEGQGLWEVWRRKDNKTLAVVLYFFLQRDAPSSPSVLIGSWEHPFAGCADVNWAWRTSAAGSNIPGLPPPLLLPSSPSFTHPFSPSHLPDLNLDHYRLFCISLLTSSVVDVSAYMGILAFFIITSSFSVSMTQD